MKTLSLLVCLLLLGGRARAAAFDFAQLRCQGLSSLGASKAQLVRRLGAPLRTVEPHYECGEYSSEQLHQRVYQLRYRHAFFLGNTRQGYDLQLFRFVAAGQAGLAYGHWRLNASTTLRDFTRMLGKLETYQEPGNTVTVVVRDRDSAAVFTFRNGKLAEYRFDGVGC